jgi:hypothetical protein
VRSLPAAARVAAAAELAKGLRTVTEGSRFERSAGGASYARQAGSGRESCARRAAREGN